MRTTKALAKVLAARCRALRDDLLASGAEREVAAADAAAERRVFAEVLASEGADGVDWTYLYQEFVGAFAPARRRALGVYYTPLEVVRAQVRLAADVLERRLGCSGAFADPRVLIVDPAAGSGAYPLAVVADVLARSRHGPPHLAERLWLLEPMVGAASIARARLTAALATADGLRVDERDALTAPLKLEAPVVVCLGNPPYHRHPSHQRPDARSLVHDFVEPGAGLHAKNLYNEYVYFWRWALRHVLEQRTGPGIVSFVTAASYLRGPGFAGMRRLLRALLDELWIVDLEGDHLAARSSDNVFPIRTPVAIAMGVRYGVRAPTASARVHYARLDGTRVEKLAALAAVHRLADLPWRSVLHGRSLPLVPQRRDDYATWPKLTDLFPRQLSGAQLKRTWPIAPTPAVLRERWARLLDLPSASRERAAAFRETRDRDLDSTPCDLHTPSRRLEPLRALTPGDACLQPVRYAYRSFDRQWVLPDARLGDFMRPTLWRIAGPRQVFLTSMLTNVLGPGPAAVATALVPDLDCFRGSFGARAVIPLWSDADASVPNVAVGLLERLAAQFGFPVSPEQLFAYCYALLGTRGFQARFEDELRTPGPRVPLTADAQLFQRAVALGQRLVALHTFGQCGVSDPARPGSVPDGRARMVVPVGASYPREYVYDAECQTLRLGTGAFGPVGTAVWMFSVSGLRVVAGWLDRRVARPPRKRRSSPLDAVAPRTWTDVLSQELLEVLWVVEATIAMEPALDTLLGEIVTTLAASQAALARLGRATSSRNAGTASG
ncbi:MAG TPA: type ISP restriction/modification enzyme [Chloroflexota bacterium]|nr:type ISP restriction/modification enzyme [Chloroflexota bacterium]